MGKIASKESVQFVTVETLSGDRPIMVLAPHPDDESLGCGALLSEAFAGPGAHVVCMTDGACSHPNSSDLSSAELAARRAAELDTAVAALGGSPADVTRFDLPDAGMGKITQDYDAIAHGIAKLALRLRAGLILTTAPTDPHCDHIATAEIGRRAATEAGLRCLFYPIWSRWADPNFQDALSPLCEYRLDASGMRERKRLAITAHASQLGCATGKDTTGAVLPPGFVEMFLGGDEMFFECAP